MKPMQVRKLSQCKTTRYNFHAESSEEDLLDECVSCGEHADIYCEDCRSSRCKVCNDQWHKHPKRNHHNTRVSPR